MKKTESIGMWMMLGALLLAGSCERLHEPGGQPSDSVIGFVADVAIVADETKGSTLDQRTSFDDGDMFRVYARRIGEGRNTRVFGDDGTLVEWDDTHDKWTYTPTNYWYWVNQSNYYDFLAVYPDPDGDGKSERMTDGVGNDIPGNLAIQKAYALTISAGALQAGTDFLMAGTRRTGANLETRTGLVSLTFRHMLSAVKVTVTNDSDGTSLTLNSIQFDNLIHSAKAKVTIDAMGQPEFSWIDTQRRSDKVSVYTGTPGPTLSTGDTYNPEDNNPDSPYDLLIPADLSVAIDGSPVPVRGNYNTDLEYETELENYRVNKLPHLIVNFTPEGGDPTEKAIVLTDIQQSRFAEDDPLLEWEPGIRYTYNISIRLDGGVLVTVVTTAWESIAAETPGLLIE